MTTAWVVFAPGFEEIEAITPVDVLRRAGIEVVMVGVEELQVTGSHGITVQMDALLSDLTDQVADAIVLPGGMPGAQHLTDSETVMEALHRFDAANKTIAAICAAPMALGAAELLTGKTFTCAPGFEERIEANQGYTAGIVEVDGRVITGRGAGVALPFAYQVAESLGHHVSDLKEKMQFNQLLEVAGEAGYL